MSLKAILDSVDGLSEDEQKHYTEKDGKHYLGVIAVDGLELSETSGLKSAFAKEKDNAKKFKKALDAFGDMDANRAQEALAKMDEIANWSPDQKTKEAQVEFEKQLTDKLDKERKKQIAKFEEEQGTLTKRNGVLEGQLRKSMIDMAASKAIIDAGGEPELLLHKVTNMLQIHEEDGVFSTVVVDKDGTPKRSTKAGDYQNLMTIEEYVTELKENPTLAPAFKGSGATGTGANNSKSSGSQKKHSIRQSELSDFSLYKARRAAAAKDGETLTVIPD